MVSLEYLKASELNLLQIWHLEITVLPEGSSIQTILTAILCNRSLMFTFAMKAVYPIYQPLRSGRIWHKVNF